VLVVGAATLLFVAGCGGGPEWFSAPAVSAGRDGRQAAVGTGSDNGADIGHAVAGNCPTRFHYEVMRVRVEVTAGSTEDVVAFFTDADSTFERIRPGSGHTWTWDRDSGSCKFAGPGGEIDTVDGPVRVETAEGFTNVYMGAETPIDVTLNGLRTSVREGTSKTVGNVEIVRPADPATRTVEIVLRVRNGG